MDSAICPICSKDIYASESANALTVKGVVSLLEASTRRKDTPINVTVGQKVHSECRKKYTLPKEIEKYLKKTNEPSKDQVKRLRSLDSFNFQIDCLFCSNTIAIKEVQQYSKFSTLQVQEKLLKICEERDDEWGHQVKGRISFQ